MLFRSNVAAIQTKVLSGSAYLVSLTVQAKAVNLSQASQLWLLGTLRTQAGGGPLTKVMVIPSYGVNEKGQIIQTIQLSAVYTPSTDNEKLTISVTEKSGKKIGSLVGTIQLTKIQLQGLSA